mmetsp:Transcript_598/g.1958  ORF Transcript_598/g.1958 Transcript_598/m.1958 type:complete len:255 (-) Transcript_598:573-1337(-)
MPATCVVTRALVMPSRCAVRTLATNSRPDRPSRTSALVRNYPRNGRGVAATTRPRLGSRTTRGHDVRAVDAAGAAQMLEPLRQRESRPEPPRDVLDHDGQRALCLDGRRVRAQAAREVPVAQVDEALVRRRELRERAERQDPSAHDDGQKTQLRKVVVAVGKEVEAVPAPPLLVVVVRVEVLVAAARERVLPRDLAMQILDRPVREAVRLVELVVVLVIVPGVAVLDRAARAEDRKEDDGAKDARKQTHVRRKP